MRYQRSRFSKFPAYKLWCSTKVNASKNGYEHSITVQDIPLPKTCKYLGVELEYRQARGKGAKFWNSASVDRIDSSKGYVPGNIQVISFLANKMKSNATPEQLVAFARGVLSDFAPRLAAPRPA